MIDNKELETVTPLSVHEAVCAERYSNLIANIANMSTRVARLESLVWVVAGAMIVGMAGLIVTLFLRQGHGP